MKRLKKKLLNLMLARLFLAITEEDVIPLRDVPPGMKKELRAQAKFIRESDVWKRLVISIKAKAQEQMFVKSQSWDDMYFGKAVLYVIDLLDKRIEALSNIKNVSDE